MKTLVIIPAYNEEKNILQTLENLRTYAPDVDVIVINDCSTDKTRQVLRENKIPFLDLPINLGIGGGVQTGYQYAKEHGYDIAIQFDGDGQHDARYLHALIEPLETDMADVVVGSRFLKREGFQSTRLRRMGIWFLSWLINVLAGVKVHDVTSGMRAVNRRMIAVFAASYAQDYPEPEAILASGLMGARVLEVPVQMKERLSGTSTINCFKSFYYMVKVSLALIIERTSMTKKVRT